MKKILLIVLGLTLFLFAVGCKKKAPAPPPPPPPPVEKPTPPPAQPVIGSFAAEPSTIEKGQASTLRWSTENATDVSIDPGIGSAQSSGSRQVYPGDTTTYTLTAKGPGGSVTATATVTVTAPPPPPPPAPVAKKGLAERLATEVQDALYDYDKSDVREDARATLTRDADALKAILTDFPDAVVQLEGHCDERGSAEYNLGLGDRRATSAKDFLVQLGVPADKLKTISYGKERPQCTESNEGCWQKNRRAHFSTAQ
jgi:peptidoglycan-associated lipoprotein